MTDWQFIYEKWVLGQHRPRAYEPEVMRALKRIKGLVFLDIGANVGIYSLGLRRNFQRVFAFEPNPKAAEELSRLRNHDKAWNVYLEQCALSDKRSQAMFYLDRHVGLTGSADTLLEVFEYKPNTAPAASHTFVGEQGVMVETRKLDDLNIAPTYDLVKIDVEGAEFLVLKGAHESLKGGRIRKLMVELHNRDRSSELENLLRGYGFSTQWLDSDRIFAVLK